MVQINGTIFYCTVIVIKNAQKNKFCKWYWKLVIL